MKIVSTVPAEHLEAYGFTPPAGTTVVYADDYKSDDDLIDAVGDAEAMLVFPTQWINRAVIEAAPNLRLIHSEGLGFDKIDLEAATQCGIPVSNGRGCNEKAVAEHTVGMIIAALRRMAESDRDIDDLGYVESQKDQRGRGLHELSSMRVGLVGAGGIGRETARLLKAFGCEVVYYDVAPLSAEQESELGVKRVPLQELIESSDVVSLHLPVLPETKGIIGAEELAAMKPTALLVNTSRGELVDQEALAAALESGDIYGAALDVVAPEPPPADHPMLTLSPKARRRLLMTPHVAGTTEQSFTRMVKIAMDNLKAVADGNAPINVVNGVKTS